MTRTREAGRFVPGLGHPVHKVEDPRTPVLLRIAEEEGLRRPHLRLFEAVGRVHEQVLGRRLPLNGAGYAAPLSPTSGCRSSCCAGSPSRPRPPGCSGSSPRSVAGGRHGRLPRRRPRRLPEPPRRLSPPHTPRAFSHRAGGPMATVAAVIASTHHPFYYRASTSTGADRPPFADEWVEKIEQFRETLTRARPDVLLAGRQRPLPPAVAGQHAAVPRRQGAVLRRQLLQRGAPSACRG